MRTKQKVAYCPACDASIKLEQRAKIGLSVTCKSCETSLEVVDVEPITLDWIYEDDDTRDLYEDDDEYDFGDYDY